MLEEGQVSPLLTRALNSTWGPSLSWAPINLITSQLGKHNYIITTSNTIPLGVRGSTYESEGDTNILSIISPHEEGKWRTSSQLRDLGHLSGGITHKLLSPLSAPHHATLACVQHPPWKALPSGVCKAWSLTFFWHGSLTTICSSPTPAPRVEAV